MVTEINYDPQINDLLIRYSLLVDSHAWFENSKDHVSDDPNFVEALMTNLENEMDMIMNELNDIYKQTPTEVTEAITEIERDHF